jgi:hypothetical protein
MKMTLDLPEDLLREAKILAIQEGKTFKDKMTELLTLGLEILDAEEAANEKAAAAKPNSPKP